MLTTGLLTLNIHDSLTFEGTELCLNPDLFSADLGSQRARSAAHGHHDENRGAGGSGIGLTTSMNSGYTAGTSSPLAVGDTVEIRVWDPLPKEHGVKGPSSSGVMRNTHGSTSMRQSLMTQHRQPSSSSLGGILHTGSSVSDSRVRPSTGTNQAVVPSMTSLPVRPTPHDHSLLQSSDSDRMENDGVSVTSSKESSRGTSKAEESNHNNRGNVSLSDPAGEVNDDDSPTKTVVTPNFMSTTPPSSNVSALQSSRPVFQRNRTSTADGNMTTGINNGSNINKPPKPSTIHRRASSTSAGVVPHRSPKLSYNARHTRDISDMTTETHQLVMDIHATDSHELTTMVLDDIMMVGSDLENMWSKTSSTHRLRLSFVIKVTEKTLTSLTGNSRTQISMLRQVADLYSLSSYDTVTVHKIEAQDEEEVLKAVSADFVVVTIKDQFISRGDMVLFQAKLIGSWIYEGQRLTESTRGIMAHAREIRHGNFSAKSGIVTDKTMITFRSRSARIIWLVQLSSEMWDYASPYEHQFEPESVCEIYFDQWIRFLFKLFTKWKELEVTHSLTVVFFSRTFLANGVQSSLDCHDVYGRRFEDHYKPVIENETCTDWESLIVRIKDEFIKYPLEVGWNMTDRRPSSASQGNVLEAINVTLNIMQHHYLDRDLHRTGQSIVIVSPGCGVFEVDKGLAGITYQRMMDNGIGSDMLSLALPPLHIAPFFLYNNDYRTVETEGIDASETYFEVPHWMHLSFVNYDRPEEKRVYLSGLEDEATPVPTSPWLNSYDIGANGFLRPHLFQRDVPPNTSDLKPNVSSFSAAGNKAATPGKAKVVQEHGQARQLISGRNFRDILEACRPRVLGASMPTPLESLLILKQYARELEEAKKNGTEFPAKKRFTDKDVRLREWGTVDFNESLAQPLSKESRVNSPSPSASFLSSAQNHIGIKNVKSDDASIASSYSSTPGSSKYGTSYDRLFWDNYKSPKTPMRAFQIQPSPSLEFDTAIRRADTEPSANEDFHSISDTASKISVGCDIASNISHPSESDRRFEHLRKIMDSYDSIVCAPRIQESVVADDRSHHSDSGIIGEPKVVSPPKSGPMKKSSHQNEKERESYGGLGAALTRYSIANDQDVKGKEQPATQIKRKASGGNLLLTSNSRTMSFNSDRRRAASPLLNSNRFQVHERFGSPKLFSSAMSIPASPSDNAERTEVFRPRPNKVIPNREWSSSLIVAPTTTQQTLVSVHRGKFDTSRQNLKPISRSPPVGTGFLASTTRAPLKTFSKSPPQTGISREKSAPSRSLAQSPPKGGNLVRERSAPSRTVSRADSPHGSGRGSVTSRRNKVCNPFRQSDEDEVLAKRSHNRRRWSHVFPAGEVEFKRHAGPIWNSLTSPAILPLSVDYFPSPQELRDKDTFQFNFYQVTLGGIENNHYASHADLLMEMVRQRVTQDFQIVTEAAIAESERRSVELQREGRNMGKLQPKAGTRRPNPFPRPLAPIKQETHGTIKHYMSMGHRIQVMKYNPDADNIEITVYNRKSAQNDPMNVYDYKFLLFSHGTQCYTKSIQTFKKYSEPYKWNRVDNLICGEEDRTMDVSMRFRRVMFGLIPDPFKDVEAEMEYVNRFEKLLSYLEKLRDKNESASKLNVEIVTSKLQRRDDKQDRLNTGRDMTDTMIRFSVQLVRGKKDPFEWIEIAIDPIFDTSRSYRIMFNWLVATSAKVETQLQLLHRRCTQFGLKLISFPQTSVAWNLFLHAFASPTFICIDDKEQANHIDAALEKLDFIYDGVTISAPQFLCVLDNSENYSFPQYRSGKVKAIPAPQYVHRSASMFIRKMEDKHGKVILVGIENHRHASNENRFRDTATKVLNELLAAVVTLRQSKAQAETSNSSR